MEVLGVLTLCVNTQITALTGILNRILFMPLAPVGMLHKTAGKRRGHQPQAVGNLAQELPGTCFSSWFQGAALLSCWLSAVVPEAVK